MIKYFNKRTEAIGELFSHNSKEYFCLQKPKTTNNVSPYGQIFIKRCAKLYDTLDEIFVITVDGKIMTNENLCLDSFRIQSSDYSSEKNKDDVYYAKMVTCSTKTTQYFVYNSNVSKKFISLKNSMCGHYKKIN
jgi:hypothetical protein